MIIARTATPPAAPPAMAPTGALFEAAVTAVGLCVDVVEDVVDEAAAEDPPLGENDAATAGFELRKPGVRSSVGHPFCWHGLDLQHPMNAGFMFMHVYHRLPFGHCWSGNLPE